MRRVYTVLLFTIMASIDNTVLSLLPALAPRVRGDLGVSDRAVGLIIGANLAVVALTALFWGYRSDQADRKRLLIGGTLVWAAPVGLIPAAGSYPLFLGLMLLAGLGLGCISTVGYSIITDLVAERWRGLVLGLWGLAQGIGSLTAGLLAGLHATGAGWRTPFGIMAGVGLFCSFLALFALAPRKGAADEALQQLAPEDAPDDYRITFADLPFVLRKPTNRWIMLQGLLAQFAYGSLTWITALLTAKLVAQQVDLALANGIAALLWVILQLGGVFSLVWGWLGDRLQRRNPRARALLAAYGFWIALPCYLVLFWAPLPLIGGDLQGSASAVVAGQLGRNLWWWVAVLAATCAVAAQATNAPNWFAMVAEVNVPEHRGTAFSFITLAGNAGRALGAFFVAVCFDWLQRTLPSPANYALGLSLFQLFFIPAGLCFWLAARTAPTDAAAVQEALRRRATATLPPPSPRSSPSPAAAGEGVGR